MEPVKFYQIVEGVAMKVDCQRAFNELKSEYDLTMKTYLAITNSSYDMFRSVLGRKFADTSRIKKTSSNFEHRCKLVIFATICRKAIPPYRWKRYRYGDDKDVIKLHNDIVTTEFSCVYNKLWNKFVEGRTALGIKSAVR